MTYIQSANLYSVVALYDRMVPSEVYEIAYNLSVVQQGHPNFYGSDIL